MHLDLQGEFLVRLNGFWVAGGFAVGAVKARAGHERHSAVGGDVVEADEPVRKMGVG